MQSATAAVCRNAQVASSINAGASVSSAVLLLALVAMHPGGVVPIDVGRRVHIPL